MRQNGTNWADGVPGISQCPIQPGSSFTYKFTLDSGELGTYCEFVAQSIFMC